MDKGKEIQLEFENFKKAVQTMEMVKNKMTEMARELMKKQNVIKFIENDMSVRDVIEVENM